MRNLLEWIHSKGNIHSWAVGKESCQSSLLKQSKDKNFVPVLRNCELLITDPYKPIAQHSEHYSTMYYGLYLLHSLLEDRIPPGLTDDQICPLHNHNTDKEGGVARELHNLSLLICLERIWKH